MATGHVTSTGCRVHLGVYSAPQPARENAVPRRRLLGMRQDTGALRLPAEMSLVPVLRSPAPSVVGVRRQAAPVRRPPFDDQPAALRRVLENSYAANKFGCTSGVDPAQCFNRLDQEARMVLVSLYNRLTTLGMWHHVRFVGGLWTSGVGGAHLTVDDHRAFFAGLLASGRFCVDTALGGILHRGSTSVREITSGDSLHLSIDSGNMVSAHVDAISPVASAETGGRCRYDPVRAQAHIGREVAPLAVPGLQLFPEPPPIYGLPERGEAAPQFIRLELFRF
jgi:hypothetical protein